MTRQKTRVRNAPSADGLRRELDVHREELAAQNEELRTANAALLAARNRYAMLYESCPVAYVTLDAKGLVVEANSAVGDLLGGPRRNVFGRTFEELVAPSSRDSFRRFRQRVVELGTPHALQTVLATRVRRIPVRIQGAPFAEAECLLAISDETEHRRRVYVPLPAANDAEPPKRRR